MYCFMLYCIVGPVVQNPFGLLRKMSPLSLIYRVNSEIIEYDENIYTVHSACSAHLICNTFSISEETSSHTQREAWKS